MTGPNEQSPSRSPPPQTSSNTTPSHLGGLDLSFAHDTWTKLAASECRLRLLNELVSLNLGFCEVEEYSLALNEKFRLEAFKLNSELSGKKIVKEAMSLKLRDEQRYNHEMTRVRNKCRFDIGEMFGRNTRRSRTIMKNLRNHALKIKSQYDEKYKNKLSHLLKKYREDSELKLDKVPDGLEIYENLSIFDKAKFDDIIVTEYDVAVVGDITLSEDEKSILRINPKFALMNCLKNEEMSLDLEMGCAKLRYTLGRENDERLDDEVEITEEEEEKLEEIDARSRQFFDPGMK